MKYFLARIDVFAGEEANIERGIVKAKNEQEASQIAIDEVIKANNRNSNIWGGGYGSAVEFRFRELIEITEQESETLTRLNLVSFVN